jgi:hypothetical protein
MTKSVVHTNSHPSAKKNIVKKSAEKLTEKSLRMVESRVKMALATQEKSKALVFAVSEKAKIVVEKASKSPTRANTDAAKRAKETMRQAIAKREEATVAVKQARETLSKVKGQFKMLEAERRLAERKEAAKQKAVDAFIKRWEASWNQKMKAENKNRLDKSQMKKAA